MKFVYVDVLRKCEMGGGYKDGPRVAINAENVEAIQLIGTRNVVDSTGTERRSPISVLFMASGGRWEVPFEDYEVVAFMRAGKDVTVENVGRVA